MTSRLLHHSPLAIKKAMQADYPELIGIWERSVRATHHFLRDTDIIYYRQLILDHYFATLDLYYLATRGHRVGFVGILADKIEMLFIDPLHMGMGHGRILLEYAITTHGAVFVDVNEHNPAAVRFYEKNGFVAFQRDEKDGEGKDFPILKMRLGHTPAIEEKTFQ